MIAYTLFSGSSGNSIYLQEGDTRLLVDVGGSMKQMETALQQVGSSLNEINGILITHEHTDHTKGLPVLSKHYNIPVFCQSEVAKEMYMGLLRKNLNREATCLAKNIRTVKTEHEYEIGDISFTPFQTPHDSVDSQGFVFGERELGIATDLGHVSEEVRRYMKGCQNVILESNHDYTMLLNGPYPPHLKERVSSQNGHLNNHDCAAFVAELFEFGCQAFTLFHLSQENNLPSLALEESKKALKALGAEVGRDYALQTAHQYEVTKVL